MELTMAALAGLTMTSLTKDPTNAFASVARWWS